MMIKGGIQRHIGNCCFYRMAGWSLIHRECVNLVWDAKSGIDRTFSDIEELALQCRFLDCTHTVEPGCAVQKALKNGTLSKERM